MDESSNVRLLVTISFLLYSRFSPFSPSLSLSRVCYNFSVKARYYTLAHTHLSHYIQLGVVAEAPLCFSIAQIIGRGDRVLQLIERKLLETSSEF